jgi:hypothetical protein
LPERIRVKLSTIHPDAYKARHPNTLWFPAGNGRSGCPPHLQTPLTQFATPVHALLQDPQLSRLFVLSTQALALAHRLSGDPQTHLPPAQSVPPPHLVPHAPQLFESAVKSVHAPLGVVSVGAQRITVSEPTGVQPQTPLVQSAPGGQTLPQRPQLFGSALVFTHVMMRLIGHMVVGPAQVHPPMG